MSNSEHLDRDNGPAEDRTCAECEGSTIRIEWVDDPFTFGSGADAVELTARVPVRICESCGSEFLDDDAYEIRQEAVSKHLGRLTPAQILAVRTQYNLTRAAFADATGLGEATLGRWERGVLTPTVAYDNYLKLLMERQNFAMVCRKAQIVSMVGPPRERETRTFRSGLNLDAVRTAQEVFRLVA